MSDLIKAIEKAGEIDSTALYRIARHLGRLCDSSNVIIPSYEDGYGQGFRDAHAELQWAVDALFKAVSALEIIKDNAEIAGVNVDTRVSILALEQIAALVPKGDL